MPYLFKAEGIHSADLPRENVTSFNTNTETPRTNDGRGTDTAVTLCVTGQIRSVAEGSPVKDETINLARWATEYEDAKAYSSATATAVSAGQVLRRVVYPYAFVVGYSEKFSIKEGVGTYNLVVRQKKDLLDQVVNTGGYGG